MQIEYWKLLSNTRMTQQIRVAYSLHSDRNHHCDKIKKRGNKQRPHFQTNIITYYILTSFYMATNYIIDRMGKYNYSWLGEIEIYLLNII